MVSLAQIVIHLYPTARPQIDFEVSDDGTGQQITKWNAALLGPQPTQATLLAAQTAAQTARDADDLDDATVKAELNTLRAKPRAQWTQADILSAVIAILKHLKRSAA